MPTSIARIAFLVCALSGNAQAAELDDFNVAMEKASSHNRVAIGYLRTGNIDLASLELDRLRDAWGATAAKFGRPFGPFAAHAKLYTTTFLDVSTRLVAASIMMNSGRPDNVRQSLTAIRAELSDLRKNAGVPVLADCVRDSNDAMDALFIYNNRDLDWTKPGLGNQVAAAADAYRKTLDRCDRMAGDDIGGNPDFRRLVDGARAGLGLFAETIAARDTDRLHRILIELRSFDNLLAFRYG